MARKKKEDQVENKLEIISVITTFYNAEKFIFNTLNSINQQIIEGFDFEYLA